jgi:glycosyltransferase involved in cell wall biosynthesis
MNGAAPLRRMKVSAIVACYNELGNIALMYRRLTTVLSGLAYDYELIFVENGSRDASLVLLETLADSDPHVHVVVLSRNFGSQAAFSSGLDYATGDCAVLLDGDLQDPPELIPSLLAKWEEGYEVVYGERVTRRASPLLRVAYKAFYRLFSHVSYLNIPVDAGDFGVIDRRVIDVLNAMPERDRFLRGLRAWAGFRQCGVTYHRDARHAGRTTNSLLGLFRWAFTGLISFSFAPLELISLLCFFVIGLTGIALVVYTILFFVAPGSPRGFQTILVAVLFLGSVQLLSLSIIGTYVAKIFEEVKGRPRYVIDKIVHRQRAGTNSGALLPAQSARARDEVPSALPAHAIEAGSAQPRPR